MIGVIIVASQIGSLGSPDDYSSAPRLLHVTELPFAGSSRNAYHDWLNRLVDLCRVTSPSTVNFHTRSAYQEAVRLRNLIDRPRLVSDASRGPEVERTARDWFCDGLVKWTLSRASSYGGRGATVRSAEAVAAFARAGELLRKSSQAEEDRILLTYSDLAGALADSDDEGLSAKDRLYRVETEWRTTYPHTSMVAAAEIAHLYRVAGDDTNARLTGERIRRRYAAFRDYSLYRRALLESGQ